MTSFSDILNRAVFHFHDLSFSKLNGEDRELILKAHMFAAAAEFAGVCRIDLSYDDEQKAFVADLGNEEIEILSVGTAFYWLDARAKDDNTLHNRLYTKDYSFFSPANLRREINSSWKMLQDQWRKRIVEYSYMHSDLANLEVGS